MGSEAARERARGVVDRVCMASMAACWGKMEITSLLPGFVAVVESGRVSWATGEVSVVLFGRCFRIVT